MKVVASRVSVLPSAVALLDTCARPRVEASGPKAPACLRPYSVLLLTQSVVRSQVLCTYDAVRADADVTVIATAPERKNRGSACVEEWCGWPRTVRTERRERSSDERCCSNDAARRDEKLRKRSSTRLTREVKRSKSFRASQHLDGLECDTAAAQAGSGGVSNA